MSEGVSKAAAAKRRRGWAGALASAGLHVGVLAWLGWSVAPHLPERLDAPSPALMLRLEPSREPSRRAAAAAGVSPTRPDQTHRMASSPAKPPSPLLAPAPATPKPTPPLTSAAGAGGAAQGPSVGEAGVDLRGVLRGLLGCGDVARLTETERRRCDRNVASAARTAPAIDSIPPEKRAYYDAVVKAYAKMHAPAPLSAPVLGDNLGVQERWAGPPGAHGVGFGCKLPFGVPRGWKSYHDKPPHSLKLGPIPCFITPPSGFATEEADVQAPASLRERTEDDAHAAQFEPPRP